VPSGEVVGREPPNEETRDKPGTIEGVALDGRTGNEAFELHPTNADTSKIGIERRFMVSPRDDFMSMEAFRGGNA